MADYLEVGSSAPPFSGVDQNGNKVTLADFKGNKLVLFIYPKDNTPGCTKEACNLRDNYKALQDAGYHILGLSGDGEASHKKFADKFDLPFPLLADPDKEVLKKYGVWGEKNLYGKKSIGTTRTTYIIDETGKIAHVFKRVKTTEHSEQILAL